MAESSRKKKFFKSFPAAVKPQKELLEKEGKILPFRKEQLENLWCLKGEERRENIVHLYESSQFSQTNIANQMADYYNLQKLDISIYEPPLELVKCIPKRICEKYNVLPIQRVHDTLIVACSDPGDIEATDNISMLTKYKVEMVVAEYSTIKKMIQIYHQEAKEKIQEVIGVLEGINKKEKQAEGVTADFQVKTDPVVKTVNFIFEEGMRLDCSDIHLEVYENRFRVRYRVDGKLFEGITPSLNTAQSIISRIKIMSNLNISEKRLPQDGRLKIKHKNKVIDFRVSSIPVMDGEKIVMRILDSSSLSANVADLGMEPAQAKLFHKYLCFSQGFIVITGPTGSGKTTTIYSGLMELNKPTVNISTAEDPVEYKLQNVNQTQVNTKIGLTFAKALRSFLRQDPDIILVGEIRDLETAEMAFRAAATGHLVLSTLHTTDSVSTITRLLDMGIPEYSVAENISIVVAQRLLRLLCPHCKKPDTANTSFLVKLGLKPEELKNKNVQVMKAKGCGQCNHSGYMGRTAVYEVLEMSDQLKTAVFEKLSSRKLKTQAIEKAGLQTLRRSALNKMLKGMTSVDEVMYGTMED